MNDTLWKNTVVCDGKRSGIKEKDERKKKRLCADTTKEWRSHAIHVRISYFTRGSDVKEERLITQYIGARGSDVKYHECSSARVLFCVKPASTKKWCHQKISEKILLCFLGDQALAYKPTKNVTRHITISQQLGRTGCLLHNSWSSHLRTRNWMYRT